MGVLNLHHFDRRKKRKDKQTYKTTHIRLYFFIQSQETYYGDSTQVLPKMDHKAPYFS